MPVPDIVEAAGVHEFDLSLLGIHVRNIAEPRAPV